MTYDELNQQIDTLQKQIRDLYQKRADAIAPYQNRIQEIERESDREVQSLWRWIQDLKLQSYNALLAPYGKRVGDEFMITAPLLRYRDSRWQERAAGRWVTIQYASHTMDYNRDGGVVTGLIIRADFSNDLSKGDVFTLNELQAAGIFPLTGDQLGVEQGLLFWQSNRK